MEYEISDILQIVRQRLGWILGGAFLCVILTGIISFYFIPPKYEATSTLLVQPQISENQVSYENLSASEKLVSTYSEIIKSGKVAREVISVLNLKITENELLKMVEANGVKDSLITAITVRASSPQEAMVIANTFAFKFIDNLPSLMKVENTAILDGAKFNNKPVMPRPFLYMGIVFFVAINMGVGLAVVESLMDKTIKNEEEAEKLLGVPVLAAIPKHSKTSLKRKGNQFKRERVLES